MLGHETSPALDRAHLSPRIDWEVSLCGADASARGLPMRVNMDSSIATDPRFKILRLELGVSRNEIAGALFYVWLACYERRSDRLSVRLADAQAEIPGFSAAMVDAELADIDGDQVEFHGARKRIAFLLNQAERGRKGGRKGKGKRKSRTPKANAKQSQSEATAYTPTPSPDLPPSPTPSDLLPSGLVPEPEVKKASKPKGAPVAKVTAAFVECFNDYFGRHFGATPPIKTLVGKALKKGYTLAEMKGAIWAAHDQVCESPDVKRNFSPKTILRLSAAKGQALGDWLDLANDRWREENPGKPPRWMRQGELNV